MFATLQMGCDTAIAPALIGAISAARSFSQPLAMLFPPSPY